MVERDLVTKMELVACLDHWFADRLQNLKCREDTRAYVAGVLSGFKTNDDMSRESIVLAFYDAKSKGDFVSFQKIGDWVLWSGVIAPAAIKDHREVVESIGRMSYYTCHRIMRGQWNLYEELADNLPRISICVRKEIEGLRVITPRI